MSKEKSINDERGLLNKIVTIQLLDRAENEFSEVRLTGLTENSAIVEWEARGVFHQTMIPRSNISYISLKYNNSASATPEPKTV